MNRKDQPDIWREELLTRLNPSVRSRIDGKEDFEDVVALMAAWLQATDEHLAATEEKVAIRLSAELAPGGDWKFPVQTLAIPREMRARTIEEEMIFQGSGGQDNQWRACGEGWTRPTSLGEWRIEYGRRGEFALVCEILTANPQMRLLLPADEAEPYDGQQLAFVCGDDGVVNALANAAWGMQYREETGWQAVSVTRYQDYFRFERGIGGARARQRQLAAWVPPFYPYSRKFLRFAVTEPAETRNESDWEFISTGTGTSRLAAKIDEATAYALESLRNEGVEAGRAPLILNAVPVAQMQMQAENLLGSPFRTNDGYTRPIEGVWGAFAATVQETYKTEVEAQVTYPPAGLSLKPVAFNAVRKDEQQALITCGLQSNTATGYQARIYYGCHGQNAASPRVLSSGEGEFTTPFPALGGKSAPVTGYGDAGSRHAWYNAYLRAPQPTTSDIVEILNQVPSCKEYLVLGDGGDRQAGQGMVQLDIENHPRAERTAWENYLWPTLVSEETLLEMRASFLSASQVAIMPRMRLHFDKQRDKELPTFLWREMERYAASVLSQYFMIGWYRLEGVVREG